MIEKAGPLNPKDVSNGVLVALKGPSKTRTGNANRERSEDFARHQVKQIGSNSAVDRFMADSPLSLVNSKLIPRKAIQPSSVTSAAPARFSRQESREQN